MKEPDFPLEVNLNGLRNFLCKDLDTDPRSHSGCPVIQVPPQKGEGEVHFRSMGDDLQIFAMRARFNQPVTFTASGQEWLRLHFRAGGNSLLYGQESEYAKVSLGAMTVTHATGYDYVDHFPARIHNNFVTLVARQSYLERLTGQAPDSLPILPKPVEGTSGLRANSLVFSLSPRIEFLINELTAWPASGGRDALFRILVDEMVLRLLETQPQDVDADKYCCEESHRLVELVKAELQRDLSLRISVDELASIAGTNRTTLRAMFKQITGQTISAHSTELRMQKAAELIAAGWRLQDLPEVIGYIDYASFSKAFKGRYGVPPSSLAKQYNRKLATPQT